MTTIADHGGWPAVIGRLVARNDLSAGEAGDALREILAGEATAAQVAAFLVALRSKGESVDELVGLLDAVLEARVPVVLDEALAGRAMDIVGTGGDRSHSVNVSTMAALVVAGAGVPVCKHGNRAASSSCGAADLLEQLGVRIEVGPETVARSVAEAGFGFCFAQRFHPAFRHVGPTRREIGVPTAFNLLGPLANPARVRTMLVGVALADFASRAVSTLARHGVTRAWVVHGGDGLDELSTTTTSDVLEIIDGEARSFTLEPLDHGLARSSPQDLRGGDPAHNAEVARRLLAGETGPVRDIVVLNAGAALMLAGVTTDLDAGIRAACEAIDDGRAAEVLARAVEVTNGEAVGVS